MKVMMAQPGDVDDGEEPSVGLLIHTCETITVSLLNLTGRDRVQVVSSGSNRSRRGGETSGQRQ